MNQWIILANRWAALVLCVTCWRNESHDPPPWNGYTKFKTSFYVLSIHYCQLQSWSPIIYFIHVDRRISSDWNFNSLQDLTTTCVFEPLKLLLWEKKSFCGFNQCGLRPPKLEVNRQEHGEGKRGIRWRASWMERERGTRWRVRGMEKEAWVWHVTLWHCSRKSAWGGEPVEWGRKRNKVLS